ncbi:tryptophan halogenase family protein [Marinimicrobium sp. ABcell2]|uniref:tryptophan halogenase family protein n=1 Tax=Marinimicrobium sp. ABcell2 TaxID=3069751 RepID=UPI0027B1A1C1|nr:tryptophan halogenase family protein [Marinimicrobium sp. ABcell2]MDQ2075960.1 tryptophan 7-halogenase [Marinimicrobium sp. ABcell2]
MTNQPIEKIVIAGGGTAGWMAAAAITRHFGKILQVTLVESDAIPTVGVGESTIPTLHLFHDLLKISEAEFMSATNATFKLGINFENWRDVEKDYFHSFGSLGKDCWACGFHHFWIKGMQEGIASELGDYCPEHLAARKHSFAVNPKQNRKYAYHIDAGRYAKFLRNMAEQSGLKRVEGKINRVELDQANGYIRKLHLESGDVVEGDLFIDCTGFSALLMEKALHTGFENWSHWLPCDAAIAVQTDVTQHVPYTRAIARENGWQWRIPLQTRTGNGLVFCSKYWDENQAKEALLNNIVGNPINEPRVIRYQTGTRRKHWNKNCIALGLSSGFIEPLESTSIHLIQQGIVRLLKLLPSKEMEPAKVNKFNDQMRYEMENIRDFIVLHYHVTERSDTEFWRYCKGMEIPDTLAERIALFKQSAHVYKLEAELFGDPSWVQVMVGQGIMPEKYHRIVDMMDKEELNYFLSKIRDSIASGVSNLPNHMDFINRYCRATDKVS